MKPIHIKGYENYLITKDGRLFNTIGKKGKILNQPKELKSYPNKNTNYKTAVIRSNYEAKAVYIHRLVAEAYIEKPTDAHCEVNHKNLNKQDNRVENLEWVTRERNKQHMQAIYGKIEDTILRNEKMLRVGKKIYSITEDVNDVADIWDVNVELCKSILDRIGVIRKKLKQRLPSVERSRLKEDIKNEIVNNKQMNIKIVFTKKFKEFLNKKYNTKFKRGYLDKIKKEIDNEI